MLLFGKIRQRLKKSTLNRIILKFELFYLPCTVRYHIFILRKLFELLFGVKLFQKFSIFQLYCHEHLKLHNAR